MLRRRLVCLAAAVVTIGLGLASRHSALPAWVHAYAGDALYAVMMTFLLGALWPRRAVAVPAMALCCAIEFSQAWHPAWLDATRATRVGALVLGRGFLWSDLLCYAAGVAVASAIGRHLPGASRS